MFYYVNSWSKLQNYYVVFYAFIACYSREKLYLLIFFVLFLTTLWMCRVVVSHYVCYLKFFWKKIQKLSFWYFFIGWFLFFLGSLWDCCGIVVDRCGIVEDRCGSLWDRCGSSRVVVGHCGSCRVLETTLHHIRLICQN